MKKTSIKSLLFSIATKLILTVQTTVMLVVLLTIALLMPVVKKYVPKESFGEVNSSIVTILIIGIVAGVVIGILVSLMIVAPIKKLNKGIANLANLDFRATGNEHKLAKRNDETGEIARSVFAMRESLLNMMEKIKEEADFINDTSENFSMSAYQTSEAIGQVEKAVSEISDGANSQAEETQKATENVILIGEMVEEAVSQVEKLSTNAHAMQKAGEEAIETLQQLYVTNGKTKEEIERIYEQTHTTNESALKIKEATMMIASIAKETNLLSLNASIEAARAGEQGRGFAVVAAQIQKLADQSNQSASQIEEITDSLIRDSEEAVATMDTVREIIDAQSINVEKTGSGFSDVKEGIDSSIESVELLTNSIDKLDDARVKVIDVVQNLTAIAEENAASSQETLASVTEVTATVENVSEQAASLKEVSYKLEKNVEKFQF